MPQTIFYANGCAGDDVAAKGSPQPPSGNLYPKGGKPAKRVENPRAAGQKSLPKSGKSAEKGRESRCRRLEISTQIEKNDRKG